MISSPCLSVSFVGPDNSCNTTALKVIVQYALFCVCTCKLNHCGDGAPRWSLHHSRSFKVTDCGTNRKLVYIHVHSYIQLLFYVYYRVIHCNLV